EIRGDVLRNPGVGFVALSVESVKSVVNLRLRRGRKRTTDYTDFTDGKEQVEQEETEGTDPMRVTSPISWKPLERKSRFCFAFTTLLSLLPPVQLNAFRLSPGH